MYKKVNTHKLVYNKDMKSGLIKLLFLPLTITTVLYFSLITNNQPKQTENNTEEFVEIESEEDINPSNPTPENIKVLGVEDLENNSNKNSEVIFDTQVLYNLINSYRKDNGLNKLFINRILEDSAKRKLKDMIDNNYFKHADENKYESWYLFSAAGYKYKFAGENLSSGHNTPWQVFSAWQRSAEHNEQMLKSEYLDMGLAVNCDIYEIRNKPACIVVLHLGAR